MKRRLLLLAALFAASTLMGSGQELEPTARERRLVKAALSRLGEAAPSLAGYLLLVDVSSQRLVVSHSGIVKSVYAVSTAKAGEGSLSGSGKTPLGWHHVTDWIGEGAPPGQVFAARRPTEEVIPRSGWSSEQSKDKVLSRIMWLSGLERGVNYGGDVDSRSRFIYLHGTNQEHLIGTKASHGCIRLRNDDVLELFDMTKGLPTFVLILK